MKWFIMKSLAISVLMLLFLGTNGFAQEKESDNELHDIFNSIDTDKDGKISKEEWNAVDTNKNGTINQKEWERYSYKSPQGKQSKWYDLKWFDNNSDSFMDKDEFFLHNKRYRMY